MRNKIIHLVSNKEWGGGEQYVLDLAKNLTADYTFIFFCKNKKIFAEKYRTFGNYYTAPLFSLIDIFSILKLAIILKKEHINVIHVHNFKDAFIGIFAIRLLKKQKSIRLIMTRHLAKKAKNTLLHHWLYQQLYLLLFVSNFAKEKFEDSLSSSIPISFKVVYNTSFLIPDNEPIKPHSPFRLGYLGRIDPEKGIEDLLNAFKDLAMPNIQLLIAGTGEKKYCKTLKKQTKSDSVKWLGFVNGIDSFLNEVDFLILPSIVSEAFGLSIMEGLTFGKVVISTNTGAQGELIDNGIDGFLVTPRDSAAITQILHDLITTKGKWEKISLNAIQKSKTFSPELFLQKMREVYL